MKKIIIIETCDECPHFRNNNSQETCLRLNRVMDNIDIGLFSYPNHVIPRDCPLPDAEVKYEIPDGPPVPGICTRGDGDRGEDVQITDG